MRLLQCNKLRKQFASVIIRDLRALLAGFLCAALTGCAGGGDSLVLERGGTPQTLLEEGGAPEETPGSENAGDTSETEEIVVFVCGAVVNEGVYRLPAGARLCDALDAAGGFSGEADTTWLNLAAFVQDGQQIRVLTKEEAQKEREQEALQKTGAGAAGPGRININTADLQELQQIPGIGSVIAGRIIEYREEHGAFTAPEEITGVSGIGEAIYRKIEKYITVSEQL